MMKWGEIRIVNSLKKKILKTRQKTASIVQLSKLLQG